MKGKDFEKLLKNSAETPRSISPSKGGWERINMQLPVKTPFWQPWLKFLPFTIAITSLFVWNMYLQYQMTDLKEELNIAKQEVVTLEKITDKQTIVVNQISRNNTNSINEQEEDFNSKLKRNSNTLNQPKKENYTSFSRRNLSNNIKNTSSFLPANPDNNKLKTKRMIDNNLSNSNHSSVRNSSNTVQSAFKKPTTLDKKSIDNSSNLSKSAQQNNADNKKDSLVFASNDDIQSQPSDPQNSINKLTVDPDLLESIDLSTIEYAQILSMPNIELDTVRQKDNESSKLAHLKTIIAGHLDNTKFKSGLNLSGSMGFNGLVNTSYGINIEAAINPGLMIVTSVNKGKSVEGIAFNTFINPVNGTSVYPEPDPNLVSQDAVLMDVGVNLEYTRLSLGIKKMWYPHEHIRPFVELGWMPYKEKEGEVDYIYALTDPLNPFNFEIENLIVDINKDNYDLGWEWSTGYGAAGLSASLFKHKLDLNVSLRYIKMLNSSKTLYHSKDRSAIGGEVGLAYNF